MVDRLRSSSGGNPPPRDYDREASERDEAIFFRRDQEELETGFLNGELHRNTPLTFHSTSKKGRELAEKKIGPTGEIIRERATKYQGTAEQFTDIYEKCTLPFTVRYQRKNARGRIVSEDYFRYSESAYQKEYQSE